MPTKSKWLTAIEEELVRRRQEAALRYAAWEVSEGVANALQAIIDRVDGGEPAVPEADLFTEGVAE